MYKLKGINLKTYRSTKEIQRQKRRSISKEPAAEKKTLTQAQKELLSGKIQDSHNENINKSFVGKANPVYITFIVIGLIVVFFLWIAWMLSDPPMSPVISKILELLLGGIITLAFLGMLAAGIIGCFLLLRSLLKRRSKEASFSWRSSDTTLKKQEINRQT